MDLLIIIAFSILLVPTVVFDIVPLRILFGLLLVLFSPGYVLISNLFPRKNNFSNVEIIALSFGLSIAIVPIIGLILAFTNISLNLYNIMNSLIIFVAVAASLAYFRRKRILNCKWYEPLFNIKLLHLSEWWSKQTRWDKVVIVLLCVIILVAAGAFAYIVVESQAVDTYTEFYILNADGKTENYPDQVSLGETSTIMVNIVNKEREFMNYRVVIAIDGEKLKEIGPIGLVHEESWQGQVSFMLTKPGLNQKAEFLLYKENEPSPVSSLYLWIDVR